MIYLIPSSSADITLFYIHPYSHNPPPSKCTLHDQNIFLQAKYILIRHKIVTGIKFALFTAPIRLEFFMGLYTHGGK